MLALYRATNLMSYWVAHSDRLGWVMFPARANGWVERRAYDGDTARLMAVPARLGFNTGFPHPDAVPAHDRCACGAGFSLQPALAGHSDL